MPPTLSSVKKPHVKNFYENSFKQLSSVQQKQVGLVLGAYVADSAARPLEGFTGEEIQDRLKNRTAHAESSLSSSREEATEFWPVRGIEELRGYKEVRALEVASQGHSLRRPPSDTNPLLYHSFSAFFFEEVVRTMSESRGDFPVEEVADKWVDVSLLVDPSVFASEHASLLHTLCTLLPVPAIYPYASDESVREFSSPFIDFLTEIPSENAFTNDTTALPFLVPNAIAPSYTLQEAVTAERDTLRSLTFSVLGVVSRYLQSNPDAVRNGAHMAAPGGEVLFPSDVASLCPPLSNDSPAALKSRRISEDLAQRAMKGSVLVPSTFLPRRPTLLDAKTVQESLSIARSARSYTQGVREAIRLGAPTCQRAMLVGGLLGARFGARHIPPTWLSATAKYKVLSTLAIDAAQWSWNPPHH